MYTNHKLPRRSAWVVAFWLTLACGVGAATNETTVSSNSVAADLKVDKALKALNPPVLQPVLYPPDDAKGAPTWPLYKEQPPAAQHDFQPPKPVEVKKPREEEKPRSEPKSDPEPPSPPPPPPPPPCTPNSPNWPNCLNGP